MTTGSSIEDIQGLTRTRTAGGVNPSFGWLLRPLAVGLLLRLRSLVPVRPEAETGTTPPTFLLSGEKTAMRHGHGVLVRSKSAFAVWPWVSVTVRMSEV